jgi:hypothetical protein
LGAAKPNLRIRLTACGSLTHGIHRRLTHAAAYPLVMRSQDTTLFVLSMMLGSSCEPVAPPVLARYTAEGDMTGHRSFCIPTTRSPTKVEVARRLRP